MSQFRIAIPSHRRVSVLHDTLKWLQTCRGLPPVDVFVSDAEDLQAYGEGLPYEVLDRVTLIQASSRNVVEKFNAIHRHYGLGTRVFVLEDDVKVVVPEGSSTGKTRLAREYELHDLIQEGFSHTMRGGLWGIAPHSNAFYMSGKVTETLKLVVAHAFGFVSTRNPALEVTQIGKSDYERTILYFIRYGRVVRVDKAGVKTKSYTAAGGMQSDLKREERAAAEAASCAYLVKRYPHLIRINSAKKSLFTELSFRRYPNRAATVLQLLQREMDARNGFV